MIESEAGAMGIMQLMPTTAATMMSSDGYPIDAENLESNIEGGIQYLSRMLMRFNGDVEKALAAYNAGPGAVERYNGIPPYEETQNFVRSIMANYNRARNR